MGDREQWLTTLCHNLLSFFPFSCLLQFSCCYYKTWSSAIFLCLQSLSRSAFVYVAFYSASIYLHNLSWNQECCRSQWHVAVHWIADITFNAKKTPNNLKPLLLADVPWDLIGNSLVPLSLNFFSGLWGLSPIWWSSLSHSLMLIKHPASCSTSLSWLTAEINVPSFTVFSLDCLQYLPSVCSKVASLYFVTRLALMIEIAALCLIIICKLMLLICKSHCLPTLLGIFALGSFIHLLHFIFFSCLQ